MSITQYNSSVRQMSQSKFNSMKNANGKIPDLANQIVMTNSEDSNISCLRTEVVYDMASSDASKNWGYTSGMDSGTTKSGIDLTPYKSLKITMATYAGCLVYFVDLKSTDLDGLYKGSACMGVSDSGLGPLLLFGKAETNSTKTSITVTSGFLRTNNNTITNTYKTVKIEGVLKTPSMIYTGDELIAGNGISIANGVISSHNTHTVLWSGSKTDIGDITLSDDLSNYELLILTGLNSGNEVCSFCVVTSTMSSYTDVDRPYDMGNNTHNLNRYCNIYYKGQRTLSIKSIGDMTLKFVEGVR